MNHQGLPVAVVGAGVMGHGIALLFALAGHRVGLFDTSAAALDAGVRRKRRPSCSR
jgi:3-hydroxybutyryl-CoA dehydrogenase